MLVIGADHRGYLHKEHIKTVLSMHQWHDVGAYNQENSDYPFFAHAAASLVSTKKVAGGILLCGTGVGMSIVANRYPGVYAALVWTDDIARLAKEHDNANMLVLPSDYLTQENAVNCITVWLEAHFIGAKYEHRMAMIDR